MTTTETKPPNTSLLSCLQLVGAILVIALHCRRLFEPEAFHFLQKSILSRMVVPFFMVTASFFIHRNHTKPSKHYLVHYGKHYLIWTAIYLPFYLAYLHLQATPLHHYPLALLAALTYTGTSYQLWYMPAFLLGLFLLHFSLEKWDWRVTTCLTCLLYLLGSVETYSSYLAESVFSTAFDRYQTLFYTSRNGLFYAPIFILTGYYLSRKLNHPIFQNRLSTKLLTCLALLGLEGWIVYLHPGHDKNFFFSLVPFTAYLVAWTMTSDLFRHRKLQFLKGYANYYYFIHVIPLEACFLVLNDSSLSRTQQGWLTFALTLLVSHLLAHLLLKHSKRPCKT